MSFEEYKKLELISRISTLAVRISTSQNRDIFVHYSPHVNSLQVEIYDNCWTVDNEPDLDISICLDEGKCIEKLRSITDILEEYIEFNYTEGLI